MVLEGRRTVDTVLAEPQKSSNGVGEGEDVASAGMTRGEAGRGAVVGEALAVVVPSWSMGQSSRSLTARETRGASGAEEVIAQSRQVCLSRSPLSITIYRISKEGVRVCSSAHEIAVALLLLGRFAQVASNRPAKRLEEQLEANFRDGGIEAAL